MTDQAMAPEDMVAEIANLRTELFTAREAVREANEARVHAEAALEPLKQQLLDRKEARSLERAQERHVLLVERRRKELQAELARLDERAQ